MSRQQYARIYRVFLLLVHDQDLLYEWSRNEDPVHIKMAFIHGGSSQNMKSAGIVGLVAASALEVVSPSAYIMPVSKWKVEKRTAVFCCYYCRLTYSLHTAPRLFNTKVMGGSQMTSLGRLSNYDRWWHKWVGGDTQMMTHYIGNWFCNACSNRCQIFDVLGGRG